MSRLRNILLGAGVAAVGAIGTKKAVDYLQNRDKEEVVEESQPDAEDIAPNEVAYATVEQSSVQEFLDRSFGSPGRYVPTRDLKYLNIKIVSIW